MTNQATIPPPIQGLLDINNVQGNFLRVPLVFKDEAGDPIDLNPIDIILEIKETFNTREKAFLTFTKDDGLEILGEDSNILVFTLDEAFWLSKVSNWVYDITFKFPNGERYTFVKGTITNINTGSKL